MMGSAKNIVTLLPSIAASIIAFATLVSTLVYSTSSSTSPFYLGPKLALPTSQGEALHPAVSKVVEKDPFDIYDPVVFTDGTPIDAPSFWARMRRRKTALLVSLVLPAAWNIYVLVDTAVNDSQHGKGQIILSSILAASHFLCIVYATRALSFEDVGPHWASIVHLATLLSSDFLVAALMGLLPRSSTAPIGILIHSIPAHHQSIISKIVPLLPVILHFPPFILAITMPRGPALHLPLEKLLTAKAISSAKEASAPSLEPNSHNVCEEAQVNVIEWLIFSAATPVIWKAYKSDSTELWELPAYLSAYRAMPQFAHIRRVYGKTQKTRGKAKSIFKRDGYNLLIKLAQVNKKLLIAQTALAASTAVIYYLPAFFMNRVIGYLETDPERTDMSWGWVWCFGLFASNLLVYLGVGVLWSISTVSLQARIKLQLNTLLYSKTLVKKDVGGAGVASQDKTLEVGQTKAVEDVEKDKDTKNKKDDDEDVNSKSQIMTLFTVDVDRVTEFVFHLFVLVDAPIELIVATFFLIKLLGVSALFGLLATIIFIPMQHYASSFVVDTQENLMKTRDERTALMNEILGGIRMLKFMAWERSFEKKVAKVRRKELGWLKRNYAIEVAFSCVWAISPIIVTVVAFLHFTLVRGEKLTPSIAFTSVGVFNELRFALNALPETFINILQGFVSCRRIEKYMRAAEVSQVDNPPDGCDISLNSATITWPRDRAPDGLEGQGSGEATAAPSIAATPKAEFTLSDLNLSFPHGQLSLICGRLGSGKTLLLLGLLGEADLLAGQIICPRSTPNAMDDIDMKVAQDDWIMPSMCAYVPQQAWLQNATIKNNIVFCSPWDEQRYERVLDACSLRTDLTILEDGDQTEIGEKGLNLSGGQKARVSLARAVYSRAGTLFLDDVISAVDALTADALVEQCLKGDLIQGRTVIMVSHHTALVAPAAAYVVALEKGDVKFAGSSSDFEAQGLARTFDESKESAKDPSKKQKGPQSPEVALIELDDKVISSSSESYSASSSETVALPLRKAPRKLVEDEKKERGRVAKEVWLTYFKALGGPLFWVIFIISMLVAMVVPVAENGWLRFWSGSFASAEYRHSPEFYVGWFAVISIVGNLLAQIKFVVIYTGSLRASQRLHDKLLENILFANLRFHDTTNRGRLLNRFGKDVEGLDSGTADNFVRSLTDATSLLATFVSITYVGGRPFLLASLVFLTLAYQAAKVYGPASRDMRRLDSITKSPLYSAFGDAVAGGSVIRAFGASTLSLRDMMRTADTNVLAYYWTWTVNRWCSARCAVLSCGLIGCTAVTVLVAPGVTAASAGFALAFAETISMGIITGIRQFVRLEQSMVALERVKEYSNVPQEAPEIVEPRPRASWPESGDIQVQNLVIRYAPELPNVLHKISFEVKPKMHVGVVGSTGSGKSTLALSFFRFVETTEGRIIIDGLDISKMGLRDLRSRVTIIPQDPTILSGTLRSTLDVFDEYEDYEIYDALKRTHLLGESEQTGSAGTGESDEGRNKNVFRDLSSMVNEGGDNFSQGEKQLMCMARAILKRNRLLIMDEATASVDYETDELISKTIREEFRDSTILTIAHRIHTVIDFDKILVMDQGCIHEYASPAELLRNESSKFFALCKATGAEFKVLRDMAFAAEERRRSGGH